MKITNKIFDATASSSLSDQIHQKSRANKKRNFHSHMLAFESNLCVRNIASDEQMKN